ncbi:MAG: hypothetical protein RR450_03685, partial [Oscillospiraceae bacterium]
MRNRLISLALALLMILSLNVFALADEAPTPTTETPAVADETVQPPIAEEPVQPTADPDHPIIEVDGVTVFPTNAQVIDGTTYVSLYAITRALRPDAVVE